MQMVICHRTVISKWKATVLHPQPSGLQIPQGVYPNPNYGGGGVWYYLHFLYTHYDFSKLTLIHTKDFFKIHLHFSSIKF